MGYLWGFLFLFSAERLTPFKEKRTESTEIQGFEAGSDNSCHLKVTRIELSRLTTHDFPSELVSSFVIRQYYCTLRLHRNKKFWSCQVKEFIASSFFRKVKCAVCSKADALQKRTQARRKKELWKTVIGSTLVTLRWQELSEPCHLMPQFFEYPRRAQWTFSPHFRIRALQIRSPQ